jgi:ribosomal-protein-alanine N-acetyltransferase
MATLLSNATGAAALARVAWRPLTAADVATVAALEARIHAAPWSAGNFHDALRAGYAARAGLRDGRIVAYGVLMLGPGEAQLLNLSVAPEARREGLGHALLAQFIETAEHFAAEQMFLEVRVSNLAAISLYEREGFVAVARRTSYYPPALSGEREDALVMRCALGRLRGPLRGSSRSIGGAGSVSG